MQSMCSSWTDLCFCHLLDVCSYFQKSQKEREDTGPKLAVCPEQTNGNKKNIHIKVIRNIAHKHHLQKEAALVMWILLKTCGGAWQTSTVWTRSNLLWKRKKNTHNVRVKTRDWKRVKPQWIWKLGIALQWPTERRFQGRMLIICMWCSRARPHDKAETISGDHSSGKELFESMRTQRPFCSHGLDPSKMVVDPFKVSVFLSLIIFRFKCWLGLYGKWTALNTPLFSTFPVSQSALQRLTITHQWT